MLNEHKIFLVFGMYHIGMRQSIHTHACMHAHAHAHIHSRLALLNDSADMNISTTKATTITNKHIFYMQRATTAIIFSRIKCVMVVVFVVVAVQTCVQVCLPVCD